MPKEIIESAYLTKRRKNLILILKDKKLKYTTNQKMNEIKYSKLLELKDCIIDYINVDKPKYGYLRIIVDKIINNNTGEVLYNRPKSMDEIEKENQKIIDQINNVEDRISKLKEKILEIL